MSTAHDPSAFWDARYEKADLLFGEKPNAFLVQESWRLDPGMSILLPGDGEGRNGVFLAQMGADVRTVDASPVAVQRALTLAQRHGVRLNTEVADLRRWQWPVAAFDAVVVL